MFPCKLGSGKYRSVAWGEDKARERVTIARNFGDDTAGELNGLLHYLTSLDNIDRVTDALLECRTGKEFIERVQFSAASHASDRQSAASPVDRSPLGVLDGGAVGQVSAWSG